MEDGRAAAEGQGAHGGEFGVGEGGGSGERRGGLRWAGRGKVGWREQDGEGRDGGRGRNVEKATPASRAVTLVGCWLCLPAAPPSLEHVAGLAVGGSPAPQAAAPGLAAIMPCSGLQLGLGGNMHVICLGLL